MDNQVQAPSTHSNDERKPAQSDIHATIQVSQNNLVATAKRFSLLAQIYNWQPTGQLVRLDLPITNADNTPLFAVRSSPFWIPLNFFIKSWDSAKPKPTCGGPFFTWDRLRSLIQPVSVSNMKYSDQWKMSTGISFLENDDMPDISLHSLHAIAWTGTIEYMFKIISNTTTQGKICVSRIYQAARPRVFYDPTSYKSPLFYAMNTQAQRRKNAFITEDLARTTDLHVSMPWRDQFPYRCIPEELALATEGDVKPNELDPKSKQYIPKSSVTLPDSWLIFDVLGILDKSAGASSVTIEIWIKAGEDFQLVGSQPFAPRLFSEKTQVGKDGRATIMNVTKPTVHITSTSEWKNS